MHACDRLICCAIVVLVNNLADYVAQFVRFTSEEIITFMIFYHIGDRVINKRFICRFAVDGFA